MVRRYGGYFIYIIHHYKNLFFFVSAFFQEFSLFIVNKNMHLQPFSRIKTNLKYCTYQYGQNCMVICCYSNVY